MPASPIRVGDFVSLVIDLTGKTTGVVTAVHPGIECADVAFPWGDERRDLSELSISLDHRWVPALPRRTLYPVTPVSRVSSGPNGHLDRLALGLTLAGFDEARTKALVYGSWDGDRYRSYELSHAAAQRAHRRVRIAFLLRNGIYQVARDTVLRAEGQAVAYEKRLPRGLFVALGGRALSYYDAEELDWYPLEWLRNAPIVPWDDPTMAILAENVRPVSVAEFQRAALAGIDTSDLPEGYAPEDRVSLPRLASRTALYWSAPGRKHKPTKEEISGGAYGCPKCKEMLTQTHYKMDEEGKRVKMLVCPSCLFLIRWDDVQTPEEDAKVASRVAFASRRAGLNGYIAFYKGKKMEVEAKTSYEAQQIAAKAFKAKKPYEVSVVLAEKDGKQVTHAPQDVTGSREAGGRHELRRDLKLRDGTLIPRGTPVTVAFLGAHHPQGHALCELHAAEVVPNPKISISKLPLYMTGFVEPSMRKLEEWSDDGVAYTPTGERVEPDGWGRDGSPSWLLALGMI